MKLLIRNTHKYLSFFIAIQLLLWTISGIYFAFNKIEQVRGEQYLVSYNNSIDLGAIDFTIPEASKVTIAKRLNQDIVVVKTPSGNQYFDSSGNPLGKATIADVMEIVEIKTTLTPLEIEEIKTTEQGAEYRGRTLPLYRVSSRDQSQNNINVYIDVYSGAIVAIRSDKWRIWDLMWGLHIMDWRDRDDIANIFLKIFSLLALISSITGILLFFKIDFKPK